VSAPPDSSGAAPRGARWFVASFLTLFVVCGYFGIEAWPLTGWRLFSQLRTDRQVSWMATALDQSGNETPVPFSRLGYAYRGFPQVLQKFGRLAESKQLSICRAWAKVTSEQSSHHFSTIRIYMTEWRLSKRVGMRAAPPDKTLRYECRGNSVRSFKA